MTKESGNYNVALGKNAAIKRAGDSGTAIGYRPISRQREEYEKLADELESLAEDCDVEGEVRAWPGF